MPGYVEGSGAGDRKGNQDGKVDQDATRNPYVLRHFSCGRLFEAPWTVDHQAPLTTGFSRQESQSGLPFPPPGDLPNPEIEPGFLHLLHWQAGSLSLAPPGKPMESLVHHLLLFYILK